MITLQHCQSDLRACEGTVDHGPPETLGSEIVHEPSLLYLPHCHGDGRPQVWGGGNDIILTRAAESG